MDERITLTDNKALFTIAVEDTLNEMGGPMLDMITWKLFREYKCSIPDCLDHPEYLKNILNQVFGYASIVESTAARVGRLALSGHSQGLDRLGHRTRSGRRSLADG